VLLLGLSTPGFADTMVGGLITTDTHWTLANAPYVATQNVLVSSGATLTIDPGVEVRFDPLKALSVVSGQLIARGTETQKIRFTANVQGPITDPDRWAHIGFGNDSLDATFDGEGNSLSGSILEHSLIEYAGGTSQHGAVSLTIASPYISYCDIRNNSTGGIHAAGEGTEFLSGLRIVGNTITNNAGGMFLFRCRDTTVSDNLISGNSRSTIGMSGKAAGLGSQVILNTIISGNTVTNNEGSGVLLYKAGDTILSDNTISLNLGAGVYHDSYASHPGDCSSWGNLITHNSENGIFFRGPSSGKASTSSGDRIAHNTGDGILFTSGRLTVSTAPEDPTWVYGNTGYQVENAASFQYSVEPDGLNNVDARNVFWGTLDEAEIQAGIYDYFDDSGKGIVFYEPWAVPEPSTISLLAAGGLLLLGYGWRRRRQAA
jgi:parallel beta-helix repeat protein